MTQIEEITNLFNEIKGTNYVCSIRNLPELIICIAVQDFYSTDFEYLNRLCKKCKCHYYITDSYIDSIFFKIMFNFKED